MRTRNSSLLLKVMELYRIGLTFQEGTVSKVGYLSNIKTSSFVDQNGGEMSALLLYFVEPNGKWFKCYYQYEPYFYLLCANEVVR